MSFTMNEEVVASSFSHDFNFMFAGAPDITSLEVDRQQLETSLQGKKLFLWGSYELVLCYRRIKSEEGTCSERRETREFGLTLATSVNVRERDVTRLRDSLTWDSYYHLTFYRAKCFFSPLLGRFKLQPVKLVVVVSHRIYLPPAGEATTGADDKKQMKGEEVEDLLALHAGRQDIPRAAPQQRPTTSHFYKMMLKQAQEVRAPGEKGHTGRRRPRV